MYVLPTYLGPFLPATKVLHSCLFWAFLVTVPHFSLCACILMYVQDEYSFRFFKDYTYLEESKEFLQHRQKVDKLKERVRLRKQ